MGMKQVFSVLMVCIGFAFAKAQTANTPLQYYTFVDTQLAHLQDSQWEYFKAAIHQKPRKAQKKRQQLIKEIEQILQTISKNRRNNGTELHHAFTLYLVDLRSYHIEDYDLAMDYDIPYYIGSEGIQAYAENALRADKILLENQRSLENAMSDFIKSHNLNVTPSFKNELQKKIDLAQELFTQSHVVFAAFIEIRADQVKFIEALERKDINAAMQLLDALSNETTKSNTLTLTSTLGSEAVILGKELRAGLLLFNELALKTAPIALAAEMQQTDERLITKEVAMNENPIATRILNELSASQLIQIKGLAAFYEKYSLQAKRINNAQLAFFTPFIPNK